MKRDHPSQVSAGFLVVQARRLMSHDKMTHHRGLTAAAAEAEAAARGGDELVGWDCDSPPPPRPLHFLWCFHRLVVPCLLVFAPTTSPQNLHDHQVF